MSFFDALLNDPQLMSRIGSGLEAAGSAYTAVSHLEFGKQAQQAAEFQAAQLRQNAGQAKASAQHQAEDIDRQTQLITSRALAVAGATGGASDPGVVSLIAQTASEGAYRRAVAIYGGDTSARAMELQAEAKQFEGASTNANEQKKAMAQSVYGGANMMNNMAKDASMLLRFGNGGPKAAPTSSSVSPGVE